MRKDTVATASEISAHSHAFGSASDNGGVVVVGSLVQVIHLGTTASRDGVAFDDNITTRQLKLAGMESDRVEVVCPDGQTAWGIGPAQEIMTSAFDNDSDVVLPSYFVSISFLILLSNVDHL